MKLFNEIRNLSFVQGVKRMTHKRGVDIVLNSTAGGSLRQSHEFIIPLGRFIEIGRRDLYLPYNPPFLRITSFASVDLRIVAERSRPLMAE